MGNKHLFGYLREYEMEADLTHFWSYREQFIGASYSKDMKMWSS